MKEKKQKGKKASVLSLAVPILIGGIVGALIGLYGLNALDTDLPFPIFMLSLIAILLLLYLAFFLQIILHEGGHLVFGLLTGYRFSSFRIGSLMFIKGIKGIHIRRLSLSGTGGQCLMLPPEWTEDGIPSVLYNLGGCIFNLIFSLLSFFCWIWIRGSVYASAFFLFMTVIGLFLALSNGIPMNMGGLDNDGKNALSLRKNPKNLRYMWLQLEINGQLSMGKRLKDMPEEWFFVPEKEQLSYILASTIGVYACNRAMDEMNFEKAGEIAEYLLEHAVLADIHKKSLQAELLFRELIGPNRPEEVERIYDREFQKFLKATASYPSTLRLLYTYALFAKGDEGEAKRHLLFFNKAGKTYPYECEIKSEREILNYVYKLYLKRKELITSGAPE